MALVCTLKVAVKFENFQTGGQLSVVNKQHSQVYRMGEGDAPAGLPCDFSVRYGGGNDF